MAINNHKLQVATRKLSAAERKEIKRRERKYRNKLGQQGYTTYTLIDESGCFGVVLVEDSNSGRKGLLLSDGNVRWMEQAMSPGGLADAAVSGVTIDRLP